MFRGLSAIPAFYQRCSGVYQRFWHFISDVRGVISDFGPFISDVREFISDSSILSAMFGGLSAILAFYQRCSGFISDSASFISDVREFISDFGILSAMFEGLPAFLALLPAMFEELPAFLALLPAMFDGLPAFLALLPAAVFSSLPALKKDASQSKFAVHLLSDWPNEYFRLSNYLVRPMHVIMLVAQTLLLIHRP
ncbi:hypothetical protein [Lysinibacillus sp. G4S2]|uniref:hypothetical protein n=1 Tax=Lysinibacillus sp. G4S2 TaxID=3055859 RepID=UPI0025A2AFE5|nr:hypothetical protein [Lysinibacillus sp. G4S2]MDM5246232.1 hypothetical protein [Lysinibacillus sp. G4S2]